MSRGRAKPPKGSVHDSRHAQEIPVLGSPQDQTNDAFAPPRDPMGPGTSKAATLVYRDLPLVTIATDWEVDDVRSALRANMTGIFERPAQLADSLLGDDRIQATLGSLTSALFGCETIFEPANDSAAAREVLDAWVPCWPGVGGYAGLGWLTVYTKLMGWAPAQIVWDTTGPVWAPTVTPWHQRFTYWHWQLRRFVAMSLDGQIVIEPGDGKWVLQAPWGNYRPWIFGAMRACAQPWLIRHFAYRDWARFSEVHGLPTTLAGCPASASPEQRSQFESALRDRASETTVLLSKGLEGQGSDYTLELMEATDAAWESFPGLIDRTDMSIVLALLFQNLTTEVRGASLAATESHANILQAAVERENVNVQATVRPQVARPFAYLNFGDADLAPKTRYNTQSAEAKKSIAASYQLLGQFLASLRTSGLKMTKPRTFLRNVSGADPGPLEAVDPMTVEAKLAGAVGKAEPDATVPGGTKEEDT